ncbi:MAG: AAA family ATPase [Thermoproteota archaeon]
MRLEEYGRIWMLLEMFMESATPLSVLVIAFGEKGTGKTTLAKKIMKDAASVWKDLKTIYLDPETDNHYGFFAILQKAWKLNGYSATEILRILEESECKFLIVIDNAESIVNERIFQDILRISEGFPHEGLFILMLFSSEALPINVLTFSPPLYLTHLNPYSPDEIRMIIDIALRSIGRSAEEKALDIISRTSGGNAKLALMILETALHFSKGKPISEKHVLEALRKISEDYFIYNFIQTNDLHIKAIFKVLSQHPQGVSLKKLFEEYSRVCTNSGMRPLGYTQLWKKVRILKRRMLLDFKVINFKRGRTGVVKAKCIGGETSL